MNFIRVQYNAEPTQGRNQDFSGILEERQGGCGCEEIFLSKIEDTFLEKIEDIFVISLIFITFFDNCLPLLSLATPLNQHQQHHNNNKFN